MAQEVSDITETGFPKHCYAARGGVYRERLVNSKAEMDAFILEGEGILLAHGMRAVDPPGRHANSV
ncbi:MAG TPA: hypothetical protein VJB97_02230 [Candidatus Paceibacterota bacterium]